MDVKKFGSFIASVRKEQQMTQAELAQKLQVTDKAVSKWERGLGFPDINTIEPLADALGVSVLEIMKSERIPEQEVSAVVASDALMDAFELAKYQKKLERRHIIAIIVLVAIIPMVIFLIDNMTIYGFLGVCVPVTCLLLGVGLLIYGVWRKITKKTCWQTFTIALLMFAVPVILIILLFVVGALGIGPVPN
uniref:helix-turn-helix domain-containing protein n=1 Tax=Agathobacter sp. TaxID=2021311 RepID=UPI004055D1AE